MLRLHGACLSLLFVAATVTAQTTPPLTSPRPTAPISAVAGDAEVLDIASVVRAVTVYRGRASVTRHSVLDAQAGLYDLRFAALPESIKAETIQARVEGPARVLGVQVEQRDVPTAASPRIKVLDDRIEAARRNLATLDDEREVVFGQIAFIDALSARVSADASRRTATADLDLDAIRKQLAFVTTERTRLIGERRALALRGETIEKELRVLEAERTDAASRARVEWTAVVSIALLRTEPITVELVYLVGSASWTPAYNIRAAVDGSGVVIEYDASLVQRTGEDWDEVALTLSTAEPTVAANPPALDPWFMDVLVPRASGLAAPRRSENAAGSELLDVVGGQDEYAANEAVVGGVGPSVTYALPRPVTVRSHARQVQRSRIATIDAAPEFVHVAVPVLTDAVYVRGSLTNSSVYQLLRGAVSIFVGPDYVGPTTLDGVTPGGRFELYFGIDPTITATRTLVSRNTTKTGLLGGGRKTSDRYRIAIDNGAGKPIALEMWDRHPVSRSDEIQIELLDLTHALSTDATYVEDGLPQGLMKWLLSVAPNPPAGPPSMTVTYGVNVTRSKDVDMTPLP